MDSYAVECDRVSPRSKHAEVIVLIIRHPELRRGQDRRYPVLDPRLSELRPQRVTDCHPNPHTREPRSQQRGGRWQAVLNSLISFGTPAVCSPTTPSTGQKPNCWGRTDPLRLFDQSNSELSLDRIVRPVRSGVSLDPSPAPSRVGVAYARPQRESCVGGCDRSDPAAATESCVSNRLYLNRVTGLDRLKNRVRDRKGA